ncbi:MAG: hypothetical protein RLZZ467_1479 [Gemmatimonadota bacterium]
MLTELRIRQLAVIDEVALTLAPGFNVLTGETGAGRRRHLATEHEGPVAVDPPLVKRLPQRGSLADVEDPLHHRALRARTHEIARRTLTDQQAEGLDDDRFAGAGRDRQLTRSSTCSSPISRSSDP